MEYIHCSNPNKLFLGVRLGMSNAGNSINNRLCVVLKECGPIEVIVQRFPPKKRKTIVMVEGKQFPGILGHAITIHKAQGSILDYMKGDLGGSARASRLLPIAQGQTCTLVSCAKS